MEKSEFYIIDRYAELQPVNTDLQKMNSYKFTSISMFPQHFALYSGMTEGKTTMGPISWEIFYGEIMTQALSALERNPGNNLSRYKI